MTPADPGHEDEDRDSGGLQVQIECIVNSRTECSHEEGRQEDERGQVHVSLAGSESLVEEGSHRESGHVIHEVGVCGKVDVAQIFYDIVSGDISPHQGRLPHPEGEEARRRQPYQGKCHRYCDACSHASL